MHDLNSVWGMYNTEYLNIMDITQLIQGNVRAHKVSYHLTKNSCVEKMGEILVDLICLPLKEIMHYWNTQHEIVLLMYSITCFQCDNFNYLFIT